jgi:hypothetical protein
MINFDFSINNPFTDRWNTIFFKNGLLPRHKAWEFNAYRTHYIIDASVRYTYKGDHAGLQLTAGLFGYSLEFSIYDTRHWDYDKNDWRYYD